MCKRGSVTTVTQVISHRNQYELAAENRDLRV